MSLLCVLFCSLITDLEEGHRIFPEWMYPFAEAEISDITDCSLFATIWRLRSFTFSKPSSGALEFNCTVTEFPGVSVTVPESCVPVNEDFSLTVKVFDLLKF